MSSGPAQLKTVRGFKADIDNKVNEWMKENHSKVELIGRPETVCMERGTDDRAWYSISIWYKEKEKVDLSDIITDVQREFAIGLDQRSENKELESRADRISYSLDWANP